ncbi:hypothetical protein FS749_001856 [Ceratobasidium sp. UAMH 11750]|nr:hypothetical protein FS749_001856 [Ceratobasidium sp. UAMH 11750]
MPSHMTVTPDDTGGEIAETIEDQVKQLTQELAEKNEQLALQAEELAEKDRMLAALREAGTSERTASRLADIYGKLDEIEKLKRELRATVADLDVEYIAQRSNNVG